MIELIIDNMYIVIGIVYGVSVLVAWIGGYWHGKSVGKEQGIEETVDKISEEE